MRHGHPRLLHGGGCQRRETDHIAGRINIGHMGLVFVIDQDHIPAAQLHADLLETQSLHIALPAHGDQDNIEFLLRSVIQG